MDNPDELPLTPEEDTLLDAVWDSIDFEDTEDSIDLPIAEDDQNNADPVRNLDATPAELTEYWRNYDELRTDIRDSWMDDYMLRVWSALSDKGLNNLSDHEIVSLLTAHHDELVNAWVGTADSPGAVLSLVLAGMVAGDRSLQTGAGARPRSNVITVDWNLLSREALDFARSYCFELIKNIDSTTVKDVRQAISDGIAKGLSHDEIASALEGIFKDPVRARLIAQSESNRAYVEGSLKRWENAGVTEAIWRTVGGSACPLCKRLNGQVANIRAGWTDPETGKVYRSSAHPGDRCFRAPKVA